MSHSFSSTLPADSTRHSPEHRAMGTFAHLAERLSYRERRRHCEEKKKPYTFHQNRKKSWVQLTAVFKRSVRVQNPSDAGPPGNNQVRIEGPFTSTLWRENSLLSQNEWECSNSVPGNHSTSFLLKGKCSKLNAHAEFLVVRMAAPEPCGCSSVPPSSTLKCTWEMCCEQRQNIEL